MTYQQARKALDGLKREYFSSHAGASVNVEQVMNIIHEWCGLPRHQMLFIAENKRQFMGVPGFPNSKSIIGTFSKDVGKIKDLFICHWRSHLDDDYVCIWGRKERYAKGIYLDGQSEPTDVFAQGIQYLSIKSQEDDPQRYCGGDIIYIGTCGDMKETEKAFVQADHSFYRNDDQTIEEMTKDLLKSLEGVVFIEPEDFLMVNLAEYLLHRLATFSLASFGDKR